MCHIIRWHHSGFLAKCCFVLYKCWNALSVNHALRFYLTIVAVTAGAPLGETPGWS